MRSSPPDRRIRRRLWQGPSPIVGGALGAVLVLGAWRLALDPDRHHSHDKHDPQTMRFVDVEGAVAPLFLTGDGSAEALLILGDSRASADISLTVLARHGVEPAGILWSGFAQLGHLLRAARSMPPRRLLICLCPTSVYVPPLKRMEVALASLRAVPATRRVDARLGDVLDVFRQRMVRTLEPRDWPIGAVSSGTDPNRLVGHYRDLMRDELRDVREEHFEKLRVELRELEKTGRSIVCVRLPASSAVEEIEDEAFPPDRFRRMCAELGFPLLDLSGRDLRTSDGTHLLAPDAEEVSAVLADWLRSMPRMRRDAR